MSTSECVVGYERLRLEWAKGTSLDAGTEVSVRKSVNADRSRLFQAVTLPEYMDAWFVVPFAWPGSTCVTVGPGCFLVNYRRDGRKERFVGSYKVLRRGKVQFSWNRDSFDETTSSLVRIRLLGDFERTTVHLTHVGLDETEQADYRILWQASLDKLARLF